MAVFFNSYVSLPEGTILKYPTVHLCFSQPDHRQEDQGPPRLNRASWQTLRRAGRREAMPQCQLPLIYPVHSRVFSLESVCGKQAGKYGIFICFCRLELTDFENATANKYEWIILEMSQHYLGGILHPSPNRPHLPTTKITVWINKELYMLKTSWTITNHSHPLVMNQLNHPPT